MHFDGQSSMGQIGLDLHGVQPSDMAPMILSPNINSLVGSASTVNVGQTQGLAEVMGITSLILFLDCSDEESCLAIGRGPCGKTQRVASGQQPPRNQILPTNAG